MLTLVLEETELDNPTPLAYPICRSLHHPKSEPFKWHLSYTHFPAAYHVCNFQIETLCISKDTYY